MYINLLIQAIGILNIVLADNIQKICLQYLENIQKATFVKDKSFLNKENTYYIGLKQEQVKQYCKDLKFWKYSNNLINDPIEFYPQDNNQLLFEINDSQIVQYYDFNIYESQQIKFMVKSMQIDLVQEENQQRLLEETIPVQSKLLFCQDMACSIILEDPKIYINDEFYLQQIVTDPNYSDYYLTNTTVVYTQDGLFKPVTIEALDNQEKGKITILIKATLNWSNIKIQVYSSFSNTINGTSLPYSTLSTITTTFHARISDSSSLCQYENCTIQIVVKTQVCSDKLCTNELDLKNIHYDDEIFVQQIVTIAGLQGYYIAITTVNFTGNGQFKQNLPISIDYSQRGKALARLKVNVEWQITNITTISYLSAEEPDSINSRLCQDWLCHIDLDLNKIQFNDLIFLEYRVSSDFYSTNIQIYFVGNGQIRKIHPEAIDNSERGRVIICFKVDTFLKKFTINVTCIVSKDAIGTPLNEYVLPIESDIIECVKVNRDAQGCPTCEEECLVNSFSSCGPCDEDKQNTNGLAKIECKYGYKLTIYMILVMMAILA